MHVELPLKVKVWGDFACFTRPEAKVERVSYDVMTPSAARNILQAIFWKPQFDWVIQAIHVLRPIRRMSILRNELNSKCALSTVQGWSRDGGQGHYAVEDDRTQRHALILRDVAYIIAADVKLRPGVRPGTTTQKYREQLLRRVERGQCAWTPYLGCREFSAFFGPPEPGDDPIKESNALGRMLFDLVYDDSFEAPPRQRARGQGALFGEDEAAPEAPRFGDTFGQGRPIFFNARLDRGVLHVPGELYDTTLKDKTTWGRYVD